MQVNMSEYMFTEVYTHVLVGKEKSILHPITYIGLFRGSELNKAIITKDLYTIYMSVTKLSFYLEDTDMTLKSNHLPL